jgi:hypothetical protein
MHPLTVLLARVVDYAGLFPPAALSMADAAREYAAQRAGETSWMLGRFVVPAARLGELGAALTDTPPGDADPWPLSVLAGADDVERVRTFARATPAVRVEALELRAEAPDAVTGARAVADALGVDGARAFVELPPGAAPGPYADAARAAGVALKLRAGGVTPDAFPPADAVVAFMHACVARGVPFKLTAGLHHPIRGEHPLTYEPGCPRGTMHGFLNVLAAAALLAEGHAPDAVAPLLEERDASALAFGGGGVRWRGLGAGPAALAPGRRGLASFGSCSFAEPVADLRALGLLPPR